MLMLSQSTPKARKAHKCGMCWRTITPGETYTRQSNIGEDDNLYTWKNCTQCDVFFGLIQDIEYFDGYGIGYESVDNWEPGNIRELRLKVLWHKKWRRADGSLYPVPTKESV